MKIFLAAFVFIAVASVVEGQRRPRVHRGKVVGPVGFNLPDLKKLPSTQFECDGEKRYTEKEKANEF